MSPDLHQIIRYFGKDCTNSERIQIEEWKNVSKENEDQFNKLKNIWDASGKVPGIINPDFENAWKKIQLGTGIKVDIQKQSARRITLSMLVKIAAVFIIAIGLGIMVNNIFLNKSSLQIVENLSNYKKEIHLKDGTIIYLNHNSKIYYFENNKSRKRETKLEGEAFFKVAKDPQHPFIVHASGTLIKVLGTSFNVKANDGSQVLVSVLTGKVAFSSDKNISRIVHLEKGEQGTYNVKTQEMNKSEYADENFLAWESGKLHFNNKTLSEVVKVLSEYYSCKIEVDQSLQNRLITVSFDNQTLAEAMKILGLTLDINVVRINDKIVLKNFRNNM